MPVHSPFALSQVGHSNRLRILGIIQQKGPISRTELSKITGLSLPAVSRVVDLLVEQGYAREVGLGQSSGGRKPVLVEAVSDAAFVIGVDLGATCVSAAVADLVGEIRHVREVLPDQGEVLPALCQAIRDARAGLTLTEQQRVLGIGVATPGLLDYDTGTVITAANLGWKSLPLRDLLRQEFQLPVFVDNDANLAALAEWSRGAGEGVRHLVHITVSRGLGSGILINGQIHRGAGGTAGEIGEMLMVEAPDTERGWRTLEGLCSGRALIRQVREALQQGEKTCLAAGGREAVEALTFEKILAAAAEGDALAVRLVTRAATYLAVGIASVVNTLDPELVLIGGVFAQAGDLVLEPVVQTLDRLLLPVMRAKVRVALGTLGERAALIGAASLVLQHALAPPLQRGNEILLLPLEAGPRSGRA